MLQHGICLLQQVFDFFLVWLEERFGNNVEFVVKPTFGMHVGVPWRLGIYVTNFVSLYVNVTLQMDRVLTYVPNDIFHTCMLLYLQNGTWYMCASGNGFQLPLSYYAHLPGEVVHLRCYIFLHCYREWKRDCFLIARYVIITWLLFCIMSTLSLFYFITVDNPTFTVYDTMWIP